ncbi:MAG: bifunctional DNA-formamidopyrimidine glycosylase/DNA-(apurinic or apyrimidinic site) lyase [Acidimicrobiales bacterium]|nr:bifunctional DNA-formamidopyrimidine glycosylase/DNA-(apurinic or apyrimidinic site) lyase [Acidimicrobiales bacterium]
MPELPEVETIRRQLGPAILGRTIRASGSHPSAKFAPATGAVGATVTSVRRRGKYLLIGLEDERELVIHLGMTGRLQLRADTLDVAAPHLRAWWDLGDRTLDLHDIRRFGRVALVPTGHHHTLPTLADLGPEPFSDDFTPASLWSALRASRTRVKTNLLSQRPVAGVGNIYADEALWRAAINPASRRVSRAAAARLHEAVVAVLHAAVEHGGTTFRDYRSFDGATGSNQLHLDCYGRAGEPCRRCDEPLVRRTLDGRSTTWCRTCQAR